MARRRSHQRFLSLAPLLCLVGLATANNALSLSSFQSIAQSSIPLGCTLAYNRQIQGCTVADFDKGKTCSSSCVRGLETTQANVQSTCEGVSAPVNTVLGQTLLGNLVELLCPQAGGGDADPTTSAQPTLTRVSITRGSTVPGRTRTISTSTSLPPAAEPSDDTSSLGPPAPTNAPPPPPPPPAPSPVSTSTRSAPRPTQSADDAGVNSLPGGSPFDVFSTGAGATLHNANMLTEAMIIAGAVGLVLLR